MVCCLTAMAEPERSSLSAWAQFKYLDDVTVATAASLIVHQTLVLRHSSKYQAFLRHTRVPNNVTGIESCAGVCQDQPGTACFPKCFQDRWRQSAHVTDDVEILLQQLNFRCLRHC